MTLTALLGWVHVGIRAFVPGRVYDLRDVGTRELAGLMVVIVSCTTRSGDRSRRSRQLVEGEPWDDSIHEGEPTC